jgi:tetratricopeptide (TPR) repeat protein
VRAVLEGDRRKRTCASLAHSAWIGPAVRFEVFRKIPASAAVGGNIFINYRREESSHVAGRLHDSLAPTFGGHKLFMDVDNIPVGRDFEDYLKSQVASCDAMLAVIGPNWLTAKDETGQRRLDNPKDFVLIEIGAALARNIPVVPVLVDGARMPKASELPDSLKSLARRQAVEVRHTNFNSDAEALVKRLREALGYDSAEGRRHGQVVIGVTALAVLLLIGWGGYVYYRHAVDQGAQQADLKRQEERQAAEAEANRKVIQVEQQRLAEEERQAREAREAEEKRKAAEAEANRKAEAERQRKEGEAAARAGEYDRALANLSEAIRLNPKDAAAFNNRGFAYSNKRDYDRAIADYSEAIRINPNNAVALNNRGLAHDGKRDYDKAIADFDEAIRLNPYYALAFNNRGWVYSKMDDYDKAIADYSEAILLDPQNAAKPFYNRALVYSKMEDHAQAITDYSEVLRLNPNSVLALCNRGRAKLKIDETSGNEDIAKARQLDRQACR